MEKYFVLFEETVLLFKMRATECCNSVLSILPDQALPMLPSFIIGLTISSILLIFLVRKETNEPLYDVAKDFFQQLISAEETVVKQTKEKKVRDLYDKVVIRWSSRVDKKSSARVAAAVEDYILKRSESGNSLASSCNVFQIADFPSQAVWSDIEVFSHEKSILQKSQLKISQEFTKIFADFQKGICKKWKKIELEKGFSSSYSLITEGVINTLNCSSCPSTFQALVDCGSLGLTGCYFGNASFTLIYPDTDIVVEKSSSNILIKCFMVLQVTIDGYFEIDGNKHAWKKGEILLFDPNYKHGIHISDSKSMNVVATPLVLLSFDLWHPGLDFGEKKILADVFAQ